MPNSQRTSHTRAEIERELRLCFVPQTDNRDALIDLGFTPAYPALETASDGVLWTRVIEACLDSQAVRRSDRRMLAIQRAVFV